MEQPKLIYDGACPFCQRRAATWRRRLGSQVEFVASQEATESLHLIEPDGKEYFGAGAVFQLVSYLGGLWRAPRWIYNRFSLVASGSEVAYRVIARLRK